MYVMRKYTEVMRIGGKFDSRINGSQTVLRAVSERGV